MICPGCGCELDIDEIAREHGYVELPSVEWLTKFLKPCELNRVDADDVAEALRNKMLKGGTQ